MDSAEEDAISQMDTFSDSSLGEEYEFLGNEHLQEASKTASVTTGAKRKTVHFFQTDPDSEDEENKKPAAKKTIRRPEDHTSHVGENILFGEKTDIFSVYPGGKMSISAGNVAVYNEDTSDEDASDVIDTFSVECISSGEGVTNSKKSNNTR